jgi:hypothetical protein
VGGVGLEAGGRSPLVRTAVGDAGDNGSERLDVLGRAAEKDKRDAVGGGWLPEDVELLASGDDLVCVSVMFRSHGTFLELSQQQRTQLGSCATAVNTYLSERAVDGVAVGLADGGVLGSGEAGEESSDGDLGEHVCGGGYYVINA